MAQKTATVAPGSDSPADLDDDLRLFSAKEVADRLGYKPWRVYELMRDGEIPSIYLGPKSRRVKASALRAYIESRPTERPDASSDAAAS